MRKDELQLSNTRASKKGSSFRNMFGKRLDTIIGPREDILITLFVDIIGGINVESLKLWTVQSQCYKIESERHVQIYGFYITGK